MPPNGQKRITLTQKRRERSLVQCDYPVVQSSCEKYQDASVRGSYFGGSFKCNPPHRKPSPAQVTLGCHAGHVRWDSHWGFNAFWPWQLFATTQKHTNQNCSSIGVERARGTRAQAAWEFGWTIPFYQAVLKKNNGLQSCPKLHRWRLGEFVSSSVVPVVRLKYQKK